MDQVFFKSLIKLGPNIDQVSINKEARSGLRPSFTKLQKVSQKNNNKTGTFPTVLEIILSCFHQAIAENCYGLLF